MFGLFADLIVGLAGVAYFQFGQKAKDVRFVGAGVAMLGSIFFVKAALMQLLVAAGIAAVPVVMKKLS